METLDDAKAIQNERPYTPEEAIAIVTSCSPGSNRTMSENLTVAGESIEHLRRLGFELRRIEPATLKPGDADHPRERLARAGQKAP